MSYKVFTNGSVLNASELNEFLMNQSVIAFSNSTARGSAITTPVEGMLTYLDDTNTYQFWNGSAWTNLVSNAPSGKILQVVHATSTTMTASTTSTFADTTLSATITPTSASSRILVLVNQQCYKGAGNANNAISIRIVRGSTTLTTAQENLRTGTALDLQTMLSFQFLDSPSTTSATTYKTQFANALNANQVIVQLNTNPSFITLMEVGA